MNVLCAPTMKQTRLSAYFTNVKGIPSEFKPLKRRTQKETKKISVFIDDKEEIHAKIQHSSQTTKRKQNISQYSQKCSQASDKGASPSKLQRLSTSTPIIVLDSDEEDETFGCSTSYSLNSTITSIKQENLDETLVSTDFSENNTVFAIVKEEKEIEVKIKEENEGHNTTIQENIEDMESSQNNRTIKEECFENVQNNSLDMYLVTKFDEFVNNVLHTKYLWLLLDAKEKKTIKLYRTLPDTYKYFIIKLYLWKPKYYRILDFCQRIELDTIMPSKAIAKMYLSFKEQQDLFNTNYLDRDMDYLLSELSAPDVKDIAKKMRLSNCNRKKEDLITKITKNLKEQPRLFEQNSANSFIKRLIREKMGDCIELTTFNRDLMHKIFFLNTFTIYAFQRPQEYFYRYKGCIWPKFQVRQYPIFRNRQHFNSYFYATNLSMELEDALETKSKANSNRKIIEVCRKAFEQLSEECRENNSYEHLKLFAYHERFTAAAKYASILLRGINHVLPAADKQEMLQYLSYLLHLPICKNKRYHYVLLISKINMVYLKDYVAAADILIKFLTKERCKYDFQGEEMMTRTRMLLRRSCKLSEDYHNQIENLLSEPLEDNRFPKITISCQTVRNNQPGRKRHYIFETLTGREYVSVEQVALHHYLNDGYTNGRHIEGSIIIAAFNILFWDCIYSSNVSGVLISKQQDVPLDMYSEHFYLNRKEEIEKRLEEIDYNWSDEELWRQIYYFFEYYRSEIKTICHVTQITNCNELYQVILCIGRHVMSKIFERLVINYKAYHSGFPDLLMWNTETKTAKFVEVKGEGDTLSIKQKLWIKYLLAHNADVEVCHVHSVGSRRRRNLINL